MEHSQAIGPIILDIEGLHLTAEDRALLMHPLVGGVIFFRRNYHCVEQMIELVASIRAIRPALLLCVDQEGGRVQRFLEGMTRLPPLRVLGEAADERGILEAGMLAYRMGRLMASEIRGLGLDLSFAPVLDLDRGVSEVIGDRAFHRDPVMVSRLAISYIEGMRSVGMSAVGKHFPGHGAVSLDSHVALPCDPRSLAELEEDLYPFKELIREHMAGIMPAHIIYTQVVPDLPVGFSPYWLRTILRESYGFQGTIVSDDLSMEGAAIMGDYTARAEQALRAGCDYILICNNRAAVKNVLDSLLFESSDENYANRFNLLGKGAVPGWHEVRQFDYSA